MKKKKKADLATGVFYVTYKCNDSCDFCFAKKDLGKIPDMTVAEIKKNFRYAKKKYDIRQVILSGGEPTLHPDFWKIMDFFYNHTEIVVSLNTNSIIFADPAFKKKMLAFMATAKNRKKTFSLSLSSVNKLENKEGSVAWRKLEGVKNALEIAFATNTRTFIVVTVTKGNYRRLPELGKIIYGKKIEFKKEKPRLVVHLRGLYVGGYMTKEQKKRNVPEMIKIKPYVERFLDVFIEDKKIQLQLFNLPMCYFKDWSGISGLLERVSPFHEYTNPALREERMKIDKLIQGENIKPSLFQEDTWENGACGGCRHISYCNKIQPEYIENYGYPKIEPFKEEARIRSAQLIPTYKCNLSCEFCYAKKYQKRYPDMEWASFVKIIDDLIRNNISSVNFIGGEPSLWKNLDKAVDFLRSIGFQVGVLTNAVRMAGSMPHSITVNGNNLLNVKSRKQILKNLSEYRKNGVAISLRFNLDKDDSDKTLEDYIQWAMEYADSVSFAPIVPHGLDRQLGKVIYKFSKMMHKNKLKAQMSRAVPRCIFEPLELDFLEKNAGLYSVCHPGKKEIAINPDGSFLPCVDIDYACVLDASDFNRSRHMFDARIKSLKKTAIWKECDKCELFNKKCQGGCLAMKK